MVIYKNKFHYNLRSRHFDHRWNLYLILPILFCLVVKANSQNLIGNNGFETNTSNPTGYGQWYKCSGWNDVNMNASFAWPYASPDYLTTGGSGGSGLPNSTFATVSPFSGNAVMGFIAYYGPQADFREYISRPLSSPLIVGSTYTISFYITNGSANWYSGGGCNHVGVKFSNGPLTQLTHEPLNITPDCEVSINLWSTTWKLITFNFTPAAPYNNITIGNFYNDASTTFAMFGTGVNGAYYFIDEAVVAPATPLPVELLSFNGRNEGSENLLKWRTASEINNDYFSVERSADGKNFEGIGNLKGAGNSSTPRDYFYSDINPFYGINYYRLKQVDYNGNFKLSEIIKINGVNAFHEIAIIPSEQSGVFSLIITNNNEYSFQYAVFSSFGNLVYCSTRKNAEGRISEKINLSEHANGIYLIEVLSDGQVLRKKVLKM